MSPRELILRLASLREILGQGNYLSVKLIISLPINLNMCLGAQKNRLILFGWEMKKIVFQYALLSEGLGLHGHHKLQRRLPTKHSFGQQ